MVLRFQLGVTTYCNCDCSFCPRFVIPSIRKPGSMKPEMAGLVVDRLEELNEPFKLSISGLGEPVLFEGLFDLIAAVKDRCPDAEISLNTNAVFLKGDIADMIIDNIDNLQISLNTPTAETYKEFKKRDDFFTVMKNLSLFYKKKGSRKPVTDIRLLRFGDTVEHIGWALKQFGLLLCEGDAIRIARFENWAGLIDEGEFGMSYIEPTAEMFTSCTDLRGSYLTIQKEGAVFACCFAVAFPDNHYFCLGNIRQKGFKELLASPRRVELYEAQLRGEPMHECAACSKLKYHTSKEVFTRYLNPSWMYEKGIDKFSLAKGRFLTVIRRVGKDPNKTSLDEEL